MEPSEREEAWCTMKSYDAMLLKHWPVRCVDLSMDLSASTSGAEVAEGLTPIWPNKIDYYREDLILLIIKRSCAATASCVKDLHCLVGDVLVGATVNLSITNVSYLLSFGCVGAPPLAMCNKTPENVWNNLSKMICGKSELCIFDHDPTQVLVDISNFEEIFTVNTVGGSSDVEFNIVGSTTWI